MATDPLSPNPFTLFYYLVTSKCSVAELESSLGTDSNGGERPTNLACPDPTQDEDQDGTTDALDNCPGQANAGQSDVDFDAHSDLCDNCVQDSNPGQEDLDDDGLGNACDPDVDGDLVEDDGDGSGAAGDNPCPDQVTTGCDGNCPFVANPNHSDADGDGVGDACDVQ